MGLRAQASNLAVLHAADVLQPLLLLPYAARVLGPEHFGQYAYALSIGQIASTVVDYGFHWTAQREAASARHEPATLAAILAEVCVTKMVLLLVVTLVGLAAADSFLALSKPMFLSVMLISVGSIMFPAWLFIGLERAWQAAIGVVVARVLALIAFFAMVKSPGQLDIAVATQAAIPLISGVVTLPFLVALGSAASGRCPCRELRRNCVTAGEDFLFTFVERALMTCPFLSSNTSGVTPPPASIRSPRSSSARQGHFSASCRRRSCRAWPFTPVTIPPRELLWFGDRCRRSSSARRSAYSYTSSRRT